MSSPEQETKPEANQNFQNSRDDAISESGSHIPPEVTCQGQNEDHKQCQNAPSNANEIEYAELGETGTPCPTLGAIQENLDVKGQKSGKVKGHQESGSKTHKIEPPNEICEGESETTANLHLGVTREYEFPSEVTSQNYTSSPNNANEYEESEISSEVTGQNYTPSIVNSNEYEVLAGESETQKCSYAFGVIPDYDEVKSQEFDDLPVEEGELKELMGVSIARLIESQIVKAEEMLSYPAQGKIDEHENLGQGQLEVKGHNDSKEDSQEDLNTFFPPLDVACEETFMQEVIQGIQSGNCKSQLEALKKVDNAGVLMPGGKIVSCLLEAELLPTLIGFTRSGGNGIGGSELLRCYGAWALTLFTSEQQVESLVAAGAIRPLIKLLTPQSPPQSQSLLEKKTTYQAAHALAHIAAKGNCTKKLVNAGIVEALNQLVLNQTLVSELKTTVWLMKELVKVPLNVPSLPSMKPLIPAFTKIIAHTDSLDLIHDSCGGLYYLSKSGDEEVLDEIIDSGIVPKLVETLLNSTHKVIKPTLEVIGNIVSGFYDSQTDAVLRAGVLPHLSTLMIDTPFMREVTWIVSNIAAGTALQRSQLFHAGFFPLIIHVLQTGNRACRKEATYSVFNIIDGGSVEEVRFLRDCGTIPLLINQLTEDNWDVNLLALDSLLLFIRNFVEFDERELLIRLMSDGDGLLKIAKLQFDERAEVARKVAYILDVAMKNI